MRKYTSPILVAVFLLSIGVGVFWDQIMQVDAITIGVAIIAVLLGLFYFLYSVGRMLLYRERIDWSKPNIFIRPFLPPIDSEQSHRFTD